ncbi:NADP-dependent oxidoreductase [Zhouia sp. PK063]|uniref:NADP-dependent oxidoreductase n=1 Tax=Zhouia sp. PK063 TaxID=3373602 RepID=UPI0037A82F9F
MQAHTPKMKAIRQYQFGGPEVLHYEEAPLPVIKRGELLIRVHAIGLNPPDWYLRKGYTNLPAAWRPALTFPIILSTDVSGVVTAVAEDVTTFMPGDEVYAMVRFPEGMFGESKAYATYVTVPAEQVALKPKEIDHIHAAAAPMSVLTAWQFMIALGHQVPNPLQAETHIPVPLKGKKVLVNGAAGGVGHLAVQIAKWQGAHVIAVASGRHESFLRSLGIDEFIDYTQTDAHEEVDNLDLVIDGVGGPSTNRFLKTLKPGGSLFPIFPLGFDGAEEAKKLGVHVSATQVRSNGPQLATIAPLMDNGTLQVAIDSTFPLSAASKAHERAEKGHLQGKIVLTVTEN